MHTHTLMHVWPLWLWWVTQTSTGTLLVRVVTAKQGKEDRRKYCIRTWIAQQVTHLVTMYWRQESSVLYHNRKHVGVAWRGYPQIIVGDWVDTLWLKVEANYITWKKGRLWLAVKLCVVWRLRVFTSVHAIVASHTLHFQWSLCENDRYYSSIHSTVLSSFTRV